MDGTLAEQHDRIKAVLAEEQRGEFEKRISEMRRRLEQMRDRRRPHGRGPRGEFPPPEHR